MSNVGSDSSVRDSFLEGAARAMFVSAYADFVESDEDGEARDLPRPGPGQDWYDFAPVTTPPNAYALAGELWAELRALNGGAGVYSLMLLAEEADGDCSVDPEEFGRCVAMTYMGHGVSWFDDHARFEMKVPHAEVSGFTFDPSAYQAK